MTALTFPDADVRLDMQEAMVTHHRQLRQLEHAIDELKPVQEFAPMFQGALTTLEALRDQSATAYRLARRDYVEHAILPIIVEAVPNSMYPALYAKVYSQNASVDMKMQYAYDVESLNEGPELRDGHLVSNLRERHWHDDRFGRERKDINDVVDYIFEEDPRTLIRIEEWCRKRIVETAQRKVLQKERAKAKAERKKVYNAWKREQEAELGIKLPNFGRAAQDYWYDYPGQTYQRLKADVVPALPEGMELT